MLGTGCSLRLFHERNCLCDVEDRDCIESSLNLEEAGNFLPGQHIGEARNKSLSDSEPFLLDGKTFLRQPQRVGIAKVPVIVCELSDEVYGAIANLCEFVPVLVVHRPEGLRF